MNWPPFRPDTRHNLEGLRLSSSTGLCLTTTNAWMCGTGNLQACEVMYAFEMARSGVVGGSQMLSGGGGSADTIMPPDHTISASPDNGDFGSAATTPK